jgi:hypothetical protein
MQITLVSVTFFVGLALVVVAIIGGGLEIKEVKIPPLPIIPRAGSFAAGAALLALCFFDPTIFPSPNPTNPGDQPKDPQFLGAAIQNHLMSVQDAKYILHHLGVYSGPIDNQPNEAYFQAVGEFQHSRNLEVDGLIGPATYAKLREAMPEFFASNSQH